MPGDRRGRFRPARYSRQPGHRAASSSQSVPPDPGPASKARQNTAQPGPLRTGRMAPEASPPGRMGWHGRVRWRISGGSLVKRCEVWAPTCSQWWKQVGWIESQKASSAIRPASRTTEAKYLRLTREAGVFLVAGEITSRRLDFDSGTELRRSGSSS